MACFIAACLRFKRPDNCTFFTTSNEFFTADFNSKILFKHLSKDSVAPIRPTNGREKRSVALSGKKNHYFTDDMKKFGLQLHTVFDVKARSGMSPHPFSRPPPPLLRGRGGGGGARIGARTDHYEMEMGVRKK